MTAELLGGKAIDLMMLFAAVNSQRRILTTLGLERRSRDVTPPTLEDIRREIDAEKAAAIEAEKDDA